MAPSSSTKVYPSQSFWAICFCVVVPAFHNPPSSNRAPTSFIGDNTYSAKCPPVVSSSVPSTYVVRGSLASRTIATERERVPITVVAYEFEVRRISEAMKLHRFRILEIRFGSLHVSAPQPSTPRTPTTACRFPVGGSNHLILVPCQLRRA